MSISRVELIRPRYRTRDTSRFRVSRTPQRDTIDDTQLDPGELTLTVESRGNAESQQAADIDSRTLNMPIDLEEDCSTSTVKADGKPQSTVLHGTTNNTAGESRLDPITGEWTVYASSRSQRPNQFGEGHFTQASPESCPFCQGSEHRTPAPVWAASLDEEQIARSRTPNYCCESGDTAGQIENWSVRVVPNLFPAVCEVHGDESLRPAGAQASYFSSQPARGGHEVIIESPRHVESFSQLDTAEISLVFNAIAARMRYWRSVPGIRHVSVFKNVGRDAGASLPHSHSQLIATHELPAVVENVTRRLHRHHRLSGTCLQCELIRAELNAEKRIVTQTDSLVAYCPYASRFPMQLRITSKQHAAAFEDHSIATINAIARMVLRLVRCLEKLRPGTAYNMLIHSCPNQPEALADSQHWAIDLFPRMNRLAGFELATGAMINPIYPEAAAKSYREQLRRTDLRWLRR